jgi:hypothetical protein|tara:strand:- start:6053 stop:7117 length:1065 start_codon:yes stop_codon:yes gene_type:complete
MKYILIPSWLLITNISFAQCDSSYTYFSDLPSSVTILVGDSCLYDDDIAALDSLIVQNELIYSTPLELGTQTWFNGRLRFLVAGNYGNSSGVNDTIYTLPDNIGNWSDLASLYLEWNRLSILPDSFSQMSGLFSCYLNNNIIESIGDSIGNLENLYFFDLGYNQLDSLPQSICELENLSYFWLFNNNLEALPACFCDMEIDWNNNDNGGYPYFAIGANELCDNVASCVSESEHFELSLDQFYYSFPVFSPQDCDTTTTDLEEDLFAYQFKLSMPYPNPFNPTTRFDIFVPYDRKIDIRVYDVLGNQVDQITRERVFEAGTHSITWSAENFSSGVYYVSVNDGLDLRYRKIILLK